MVGALNACVTTQGVRIGGLERGREDFAVQDARICERLEHQVDLILDGGFCGIEPTTVVDLTGPAPVVTRPGKGSLMPFGL